MTRLDTVSHLSDSELLTAVRVAADRERDATVRLIALLAQLDVRRLYLGEGCSSLFTYCSQVLHLSEHAAYGRIEAARATRKFPVVMEGLADGSLTLTAVTLLAPHLTPANHQDVLCEARHKSKREVENLVARLRPQPSLGAVVRKLPPPAPPRDRAGAPDVALGASDEAALELPPPSSPRPATVKPLAPERYRVQLTVSRETHDKLRRPGSAATLDPRRRSARNLRPGPLGTAGGFGAGQAGGEGASARRSPGGRRLASHSGGREESGLEA